MSIIKLNVISRTYPDYRERLTKFIENQKSDLAKMLAAEKDYNSLVEDLKTFRLPNPIKLDNWGKNFSISVDVLKTDFFRTSMLPLVEFFRKKYSTRGTVYQSSYDQHITFYLRMGPISDLNVGHLHLRFNLPLDGCRDIKVIPTPRHTTTTEYSYHVVDTLLEKVLNGKDEDPTTSRE